jgi:4-amino-4-deoxy-L-arabinose transferase-like glycosyltransferase
VRGARWTEIAAWCRHRRAWLLPVVVGAVLRCLWALYAARSTPEFLVSGDQYSYWVLGQEIGAGRGYNIPPFTTPTSYYPVGWPAILGLITAVTTHTPLPDSSVLWTALWQIAMGTTAIWLIHRIGMRTWGARVAVIAAWIVALWPNLIMSVATYSIETTFTALVLACVAVLVDHDWSTGAPGARRLVAFGVVLAVAVLVRPFALPVVLGLALACWMAGAGMRGVVRSVAVPLAIVALSMVPWTIRNLGALDAFVPVSTNLGDTLCIDRTLDANGTFRFAEHEGCADPSLPEPERNQANIRKAASFVVHHPVKEVQLWGMRTYRMMIDDRIALREVEELGAGRFLPDTVRSLLGVVADAWFFAVGTLALVGAAVTRRRLWGTPARVITLATAVSLFVIPVLLWGAPRFHVPLSPFLAMGAALAIVRFAERRSPDQPSDTQAPVGVS